MPLKKLTKQAFDYVIDELATDQAPSVICDELTKGFDVSVTPGAVCHIRRRNKPLIEERRGELCTDIPLADKQVRLEHRRRQILRLEGLVRAGGKGVSIVERELRECYNDIGKETGHIQSGTRVSSTVHVHQGPEKDYLDIHRARLIERRRALEGE